MQIGLEHIVYETLHGRLASPLPSPSLDDLELYLEVSHGSRYPGEFLSPMQFLLKRTKQAASERPHRQAQVILKTSK
jgi:hypothetical protein